MGPRRSLTSFALRSSQYIWYLQNIPGNTLFLRTIRTTVQPFKLNSLQDSLLVQLFTSSSEGKGAGNIPGSHFVKTLKIHNYVSSFTSSSEGKGAGNIPGSHFVKTLKIHNYVSSILYVHTVHFYSLLFICTNICAFDGKSK
jgi:hypothetical protein